MRRLAALITAIPFVLAACDQATTGPNASGSPTSSAAASARASGTAAASASASASAKQIDLRVTVPENGAKAGINGIAWTVDIVVKGTGPTMERIKPGIRGGGSPGRNPSFPGLVILLKPSSQASPGLNPNTNLAGLFQIIGLPNTQGGLAGISSVSGSAAARAASSTDNETAQATWFVQQNMWGPDANVELTAFVVDGDAPDTVSDKASLKIVSNEVSVRFHINGGAADPSGTTRPSASPSSAP